MMEVKISHGFPVSALGVGEDDHQNAARNGTISSVPNHNFQNIFEGNLAEISDSDWKRISQYLVSSIPKGEYDKKLMALLTCSGKRLLEESGILEFVNPSKIGVCLGSTTFGIKSLFDSLPKRENYEKNIDFFREEVGTVDTLLDDFKWSTGALGPSYCIANSCASGSTALLEGMDLIRSGICDRVLAGGFDILNPMTICGFHSLQIVDTQPCKPFTEMRNGINLGEGGSFFMLAKPEENGEKTPGMIETSLLGGAHFSEGYHMTQPMPGGEGMIAVMHDALNDAGVGADEIDYVNVHGTGTQANDEAEFAALKAVFPDRVLIPQYSNECWIWQGESSRPMLTGEGAYSMRKGLIYEASKSQTGHLLAGAGALELWWTINRLKEIAKEQDRAVKGISNSFGFGGFNCSIVVSVSYEK